MPGAARQAVPVLDIARQAGLVVGLRALNSPIRQLGIGVRAPREKQETMVHDLGCRTWDLLCLRGELPRDPDRPRAG